MASTISSGRRLRGLITNYYNARKAGLPIIHVHDNEDHPEYHEHYYILMDTQNNNEYKGQKHILELKCRVGRNDNIRQYPEKAPLIKFVTKLYHPNVSSSGTICVDFLTHPAQWKPTYNFEILVNAIFGLFNVPNPASPYNSNAAALWVKCKNNAANIISINKLKGRDAINAEDNAMKPYARAALLGSIPNQYMAYAKWFPQLTGGVEIDDWTQYAALVEPRKLTNQEAKEAQEKKEIERKSRLRAKFSKFKKIKK